MLLIGCAGPTFSPDMAPEFIVIRETPLYRAGPQQFGPPDASLHEGERVLLLRHEFGFSYVKADESQTGYVANESLKPAPPSVVRATAPPPARPAAAPAIETEDAPLPKPDLEAAPADAPADVR